LFRKVYIAAGCVPLISLFMKLFFYLYYYLLANGLVLFFIGVFKLKKNPATKYYFLQYLILLILVTEFVAIHWVFRYFSFYCYADFPIRFLLTPFIYLYVSTYTNPQYKPNKKTLLILFLPAAIELICFAAISVYYTIHTISFADRLVIANSSFYYYSRTFLALLFNIACVYFAYSKVKMFSWNIFKVLSNFKKLNFIWLKVILAISVFLWIYWLVTFFFEIIFQSIPPVVYMYYILYLLIALVVIVFGYFAVLKPYVAEAYINASVGIQAVTSDSAEEAILETAGKNDLTKEPEDTEIIKNYFTGLEKYLQESEAFINPDITLVEISKELNTTSFNISKSIKHFSKEGSFYEYINRYRLLHFLNLLAKPDSDQFTINALALQSGFTSTTTLNKYCKKLTGLTPAKVKILLQTDGSIDKLLVN